MLTAAEIESGFGCQSRGPGETIAVAHSCIPAAPDKATEDLAKHFWEILFGQRYTHTLPKCQAHQPGEKSHLDE